MSLRAEFLAFDDTLAKLGVPPLTEWWREGIGRWLDAYEQGHTLELVACVGRGSSKSTMLYKLATYFSIFGHFTIPPGERHYAIVLSRLKEEAEKAIPIVDAWLKLLQVEHHVAGQEIELGAGRGIRVVAASVAAASGWRAYFIGKDERSKWPMSGIDDRAAEEIDASAAAMTATHERAPVVAVGSAWGAWGSFYDSVHAGSDAGRIVLGPTPTWIAAPHISEESTRRKERNASKWQREYECVFAESTEESLYPSTLIDRARRKEPGDLPPSMGTHFVAAMDPSLGRNAWTLVIVGQRELEGRFVLSVFRAVEWRAPAGGHFDMARTLAEVAGMAKPYTDRIFTDAFHAESLEAIAQRLQLGVKLVVDKAGAQDKLTRYENLLTALSDDAIELHEDRQLRADLIAVRRKFTQAGFSIELPTTASGRHCDYAPAVTLAFAKIPEARRRAPKPIGTITGSFGGGSNLDGFFTHHEVRVGEGAQARRLSYPVRGDF